MSTRNGLALLGAAGIWLALAPVFLSGGHTRGLAEVGTYTIAILGVGQLLAQSGRVFVGQGAFMALGGYTTAILAADHGVRELWTIPMAAGAAGLAGLGLGLLGLRLAALSTGIVTFGLAVAVPHLAVRFDGFTGGAAGLALPGRPFEVRQAYALTWALAAALFLAAWWVARSRYGRGLRAIRDNPLAATAGGLNRGAYTVASSAVCAACGGLAGSLLVLNLGRIDPGMFPLRLSLLLLAGAAISGLGSVWGAPVAALLVGYLTDLIGHVPHVGDNRPGPTTFLFGAAVIVLVVSRGLAAAVTDYGRARRNLP